MKNLIVSMLFIFSFSAKGQVSEGSLAELIDHLDFEFSLIELHRECKQGKRLGCVNKKLFTESVKALGGKTRFEHLQTVVQRLDRVVSFFKQKGASSLDLKNIENKLKFFKSVSPGMNLKGKSLTFTNIKQDIIDSLFFVRLDFNVLVKQRQIINQMNQKLSRDGLFIETEKNAITGDALVVKSPFKAGEFTFKNMGTPKVSFAFMEVDYRPIFLLENAPFIIEFQRGKSYIAKVKRSEHQLEFRFTADAAGELDPSRMTIHVVKGGESAPLNFAIKSK